MLVAGDFNSMVQPVKSQQREGWIREGVLASCLIREGWIKHLSLTYRNLTYTTPRFSSLSSCRSEIPSAPVPFPGSMVNEPGFLQVCQKSLKQQGTSPIKQQTPSRFSKAVERKLFWKHFRKEKRLWARLAGIQKHLAAASSTCLIKLERKL